MSSDGKSTSTFSNLSPYYTMGLCVTHTMEVMVCLQSSYKNSNDNKVVRLGREGEIIQIIQNDRTGAPMYNNLRRVTSVTTGEVIVTDMSDPDRIVGVDREGQHVFTWDGEIQGRELDGYSVRCITHDSNNNLFVTDNKYNRVYVLGKDGSGAMCLLDRTQGIVSPRGIAVDDDGQLWVSFRDGDIYIIEY